MIAALIPARGGSKRLSRKNLRPFAGRPLIYHSIALAQAIDRIDCCIVSTEDAEIAEVASGYGAEILERPAELAADRASTVSVVIHALQTLAGQERAPEAIVLLQPNCPLRPRALVVRAIELLEQGGCDSVVSVTPTSQKTGLVRNGCFVPEYEPGTRSQDMPERCFENGLVYVARAAGILESGSLFGARIRPLMTDPMYALGDIDTALDLEIAEHIFLKYRSHFDWAAAETGDAVGAAR
jgi:N-acylneuraminate cytidylyltransferase